MFTMKRFVWSLNIAIAFYLVFGLVLAQNIQIFGDIFFTPLGFVIMFLFFVIEWAFFML